MKQEINGSEELKKEILRSKHNVSEGIADLIARTSLWVHPDTYKCPNLKRTKSPVMYPNMRRARLGAGEAVNQTITDDKGNSIKLDDNTYANVGIKRAINPSKKFSNYITCHIYDGSVYDERYYSHMANIVLIPSILAGLSDQSKLIKDILKYRAYELYGFYIGTIPEKPEYYPSEWTNKHSLDLSQEVIEKIDLPDTDEDEYEEEIVQVKDEEKEVEKVVGRLDKWLTNKEQKNSQVLYHFFSCANKENIVADEKEFIASGKELFPSFRENYNQMKGISERNHGKVFATYDRGDGVMSIRLWEKIEDVLLKMMHDSEIKSKQ